MQTKPLEQDRCQKIKEIQPKVSESLLKRTHMANPRLIDYTSTLRHTKLPIEFDVNPFQKMLNDTNQWKRLIKAKLSEKVLDFVAPPDYKIQLSPDLKIRSRATQSAHKYATLNGTIYKDFRQSPHSLQTMASSKTPVSVRNFSA